MFEWKDSYEVHLPSIDRQHQSLFRLSAELHSAILAGRSRTAVGPLLSRLARYTAIHFTHEERIMEEANYPNLREHQAQHAALRARVLEFQIQLADGRPVPTIELLQFLQSWLVIHIQGADVKYAPFVVLAEVASRPSPLPR